MSLNRKTWVVALVLAIPAPLIAGAIVNALVVTPEGVSLWTAGIVGYLTTYALFVIVALLTVTLASGPSRDRRAVMAHDAPAGSEEGTVKWFNVKKGFGFITRDSGEDVFVHFRAIRGEGRRVLRQGQRVAFDVVDADKGLQADDVVILDEE